MIVLSCSSLQLPVTSDVHTVMPQAWRISRNLLESLTDAYDLIDFGNLKKQTGLVPNLVHSYITDFKHSNKNQNLSEDFASMFEFYIRDSLEDEELLRRALSLVLSGCSPELVKELNLGVLSPSLVHSILLSRSPSETKLTNSDSISYSLVASKTQQAFNRFKPQVVQICQKLLDLKEYSVLGKLLSIIPFKEVVGEYVNRVPFDLINHGFGHLIQSAGDFLDTCELETHKNIKLALFALQGKCERMKIELVDPNSAQNENRTVCEQAFVFMKLLELYQGFCDTSPVLSAIEKHSSDVFIQELLLHYKTLQLVVQGNWYEAYSLLVLVNVGDPKTFTQTLLWIDKTLLSFMQGDISCVHDIQKFSDMLEKLSVYQSNSHALYFGQIKELLLPNESERMDFMSLERAISISLSKKEFLFSIFLLFGAILRDLKLRNFVGAYARSKRLAELVVQSGSSALLNASRFITAILELNQQNYHEVRVFFNLDMSAREKYLYAVLLKALARSIGVYEQDWLDEDLSEAGSCEIARVEDVQAISQYGIVAEVLNEVYPEYWEQVLDLTQGDLNRTFTYIKNQFAYIKEACIKDRLAEQEKAKLQEQAQYLEINLLGGCSVKSHGHVLTEDEWRRAASKNLLLYLAVSDHHRLSRADALEHLWPHRDYIVARGSLYTALSTLKRSIGHSDEHYPYILSSQGFLTLNPELVHVDVDQVMWLSKQITSETTNHIEALRLAEELKDAYKGLVFCLLDDISGMFEKRKQVVQTAVVDAFVMACERALEVGRIKSAIWYGRYALEIDECREDAIMLLMHALERSGRSGEIVSLYRRFSKNMMREIGVAPSEKVRSTLDYLVNKKDARTRNSQANSGEVIEFRRESVG